MTGTADGKTQNTITKMLSLHNPVKLLISPERKNLRISVMKCKKKEHFCKTGLAGRLGCRKRSEYAKNNHLL